MLILCLNTSCTSFTVIFFAFPSSTSKTVISNNSLSHRAQSASRLLMSHHAPCGNLLMPLTCLSHSPPCPVPPLFLSPLAFLLFTPDTPSLLSSAHSSKGKAKRPGCSACHSITWKTWHWMSERWGHPCGRVIKSESSRPQLAASLQHILWLFAPETESVPVTPACFR